MSFSRATLDQVPELALTSLDYQVMRTVLQAQQLASAAARAEARCWTDRSDMAFEGQSALAELLLGRPHWEAALRAQKGCFSPAIAEAFSNAHERR